MRAHASPVGRARHHAAAPAPPRAAAPAVLLAASLWAAPALLGGCGDERDPVFDAGGDAAVIVDDGGADGGADGGRDAGWGLDAAPSDAAREDAGADAAGPDASSLDAGPECTTASECDDLDACTGIERCVDGACVPGAGLDCDDRDPCTADACDPASGCRSSLVDADGDGHAPATLDPSCTDCDDTRMDVRPGAPDAICDGVDSDCDGMTDEDGVRTRWADCDGDGFAATGAASVSSCAAPSAPPAGCPSGGYSTYDPATYTDCRDDLPLVFPTAFGWRSTPIPGEPPASDFDYNCNGVEWRRWTTPGACALDATGAGCTFVEGYESAIPECGVAAPWIRRCAMSPGPSGWECIPTLSMQTQECH